MWVTKAYQYKYRARNPPKRAVNSKFGMLRGLDYYVVAHAKSQFPAWLRLRTWIEKHEAPPQKEFKVFEDEADPSPQDDPIPAPDPFEEFKKEENQDNNDGGTLGDMDWNNGGNADKNDDQNS